MRQRFGAARADADRCCTESFIAGYRQAVGFATIRPLCHGNFRRMERNGPVLVGTECLNLVGNPRTDHDAGGVRRGFRASNGVRRAFSSRWVVGRSCRPSPSRRDIRHPGLPHVLAPCPAGSQGCPFPTPRVCIVGLGNCFEAGMGSRADFLPWGSCPSSPAFGSL